MVKNWIKFYSFKGPSDWKNHLVLLFSYKTFAQTVELYSYLYYNFDVMRS